MRQGVAKATTNPPNNMKKAGEGVDLACFYGSGRLIMKYVDGAKMASFLITLDKGGYLDSQNFDAVVNWCRHCIAGRLRCA